MNSSISEFLQKLVESSVEKPADGRDGDCIIHYGDEIDETEMRVRLVNGKKEGKAILFKDGQPYIKLEYRNGHANGIVEQLNANGLVVLRGHLINEVENGVFLEYDSYGSVIGLWYYRNGHSYSGLVRSKWMKGYYEERSVETGLLLTVAQYDDAINDKNGRCLEYENGEWISESFYENGMKTRLIREYRNGSILFYDENGEKSKVIKCDPLSNDIWITGMSVHRHLLSLIENMMDDSMVVYDIDSGNETGVMKDNKKCYAMYWSEEENYIIEMDLKSHELRICRDDKWEGILSEYHCIDLDTNGKRWEGGVYIGKPFGYGIIYDEEGRKEYEGCLINGLKSCYGIDYYSDIGRIKYDGCYYHDAYFGKGTLYDRNGSIEYHGLWYNNNPAKNQANGIAVSNHTESIVIPDNSLCITSAIQFSSIQQSLKQIFIGNDCFEKVRLVEIDGLSGLKSIVIGMRSFLNGDDEQVNGVLRIVHCTHLQFIEIGDSSFNRYHSFVLNNLPSLRTIQFGSHCFSASPIFSLTS